MNRLVATPVKALGRFAKPASPAGSPVYAELRQGRHRQRRFTSQTLLRREQPALQQTGRIKSKDIIG